MTPGNALLSVLAAALLGVTAWIMSRRPGGGAPAVSEPAGGLWGLLNEGADSSPWLPQPAEILSSAWSAAQDAIPLLSGPRGIRNRNPGNVKISGSAWLGKVPTAQNTDGTFEQFSDPVYGIRVIAYLLLKYQRDKGKKTIRALISEPGGWAPSNTDKNPAGYATAVAREVGQSETAYVDLFAPNDLLQRITTAIIRFENGQMPYPTSLITQGVDMARDSFR